MKSLKRFLIPLLLSVSIILSACSGTQSGGNTDTSAADTTGPVSDTKDNASDVPPEYSYSQAVENAYAFLASITIDKDGESSIITNDSNSLAWSASYYLDALYRGYCATGDVAFLDQFSIYVYRIFELMADEDGDGYLSWGATYEENGVFYRYNEYAAHSGMILSVTSEFVCLIFGDPALAERETPFGMTYGEMAEYLIDRAVNHAVLAFECDWREDLGVYVNRPGSYNYSGEAKAYSLPHNQYLVMAVTMMNFAKVSPEHRDEYLDRAEKMLTVFKKSITYYPYVGVISWNYHDPQYEGDYPERIEDYSHGMLDVRAAVAGYESGLVFSLEDIELFAHTFETVMFRGTEAEPLLSEYVNGKGDSTGSLRLWHYDMAVFGEKIVDRATAYMLNSGAEKSLHSAYALAFHEDTPVPLAFTVTIPADGNGPVDPDRGVFFWQRTANACYYRIEIAEDADFTNIVATRDKIINSSAIIGDLPENADLYVRVTAVNMKGESTVSDVRSFSTAMHQ